MTKCVIDDMKKMEQGHIVFVSSIGGQVFICFKFLFFKIHINIIEQYVMY